MLPEDNSVKLTKRELEVFTRYFIKGQDRRLIAKDLGMAPKTVSNHLDRAKEKIGRENLGTFSPRVIYAQSTEKKCEMDFLRETLRNDLGLIRKLRSGIINKESAMALATSGIAYKPQLMSENGKTFLIMSKSRHKKILRVSPEDRPNAAPAIRKLGLSPQRISPEGDRTYIVTNSELARIKNL